MLRRLEATAAAPPPEAARLLPPDDPRYSPEAQRLLRLIHMVMSPKTPPLPGRNEASDAEAAQAFVAGRVVISFQAEAIAHVAWRARAMPELEACAPMLREAARVNVEVGAAMDALLRGDDLTAAVDRAAASAVLLGAAADAQRQD
jgi:hypothetical protein